MRVCFSLLAFILLGSVVSAEETPVIDPAKAAQLRRLEPLTADKINVFVEAGQLTARQAEFVKRHIGPDGTLALPAGAIAPEAPRRPAAPPPASVPAPSAATSAPAPTTVAAGENPYTVFNYRMPAADQDRLRKLIRDYRHGNRPEIGRELRQFRPAVNQLIAEAYLDPIDLPVKIALWEEVAGPQNPDAAVGLFDTHRAAYDVARPVLIPYAKDVGGIIVRRKRSGPDAGVYPAERWFTSRELRDDILDIEGLIARCTGANAAIFLINVYAQRYDEGEAPMRDKGRDRHRMVEACGGNPKRFDEDERGTWRSTLSGSERAAIAERLIEYLHRENGDRRKIARNGLMICLNGVRHPDWDDSRSQWEQWWSRNRQELEAQR